MSISTDGEKIFANLQHSFLIKITMQSENKQEPPQPDN